VTCFYRPLKASGASQLWCRCDNCHWSGPFERFTLFTRGQDEVTLCDHYWCEDNHELRAYLREEGYVQ